MICMRYIPKFVLRLIVKFTYGKQRMDIEDEIFWRTKWKQS